MEQVLYYAFEMHETKSIVFHGVEYYQPEEMVWPKKVIAIITEEDNFKEHAAFFNCHSRKALKSRNHDTAKQMIHDCLKYAAANSIKCSVFDMPDEEFRYWEPFYYNGCAAIAEKDAEKMSFVIRGLDLYGYTRISDVFFRLKNNLNAFHENGETALIHAAKHNNRTMYNALLSAGADPNICDKYGNTALVYAIQNGNKELISKLLIAGANPNKTKGCNLLEYAWNHKNGKLIRLLLEKGARFEWEDGEEEEEEAE